ncbi:7678_t:CDS:10 [Ambispora gerdemannii]|uniref:7678_t:CDS:1 n=1 Tax=Ambispora gerdemannii TaxID=144530 RepID=A0A9N8YLE2_9GLOM|nr:7678_t:CDS:10 [Ambispora gerdemannii]
MALTNASFTEILDDLSRTGTLVLRRLCTGTEPKFAEFLAKKFFRKHCPLLHQWSNEHEKAFSDFMQYKIKVPVCGAIMLNESMDQCVLVKGWSSRSGWGFPKGKINYDEPDSICAAREVLEETGYDISPLIKEKDYVEITIREQRIRLYIVVGVPQDTDFCPRTRKEISKIEWHRLSELPTWIRSKDKDSPYNCGGGCVKYGSSRFYMVVPFVSKLRNWVKTQRKNARQRGNPRSSSVPVSEQILYSENSINGTEEESEEGSSGKGGQSPPSQNEDNELQQHRVLNNHHQYQHSQQQLNHLPTDFTTKFLKNILGVNAYYGNGPPPVLPSHASPPVDTTSSQIDRDNHTNSITAPIPRSANSNVNIAALDPEQQLRRNSILNLFTAVDPSATTTTNATNTNTTNSSRRPSVPATTTNAAITSTNTIDTTTTTSLVDYEERRRNSLLELLQPETAAAATTTTATTIKPEIITSSSVTTSVNSIMNNIPPRTTDFSEGVAGSSGSIHYVIQERQEQMLNFLQQPSSAASLMSMNRASSSTYVCTTTNVSSSPIGISVPSPIYCCCYGYATPMAPQHGVVGQGRPHQNTTSNTNPNNNGFNNVNYLNNRDNLDDISRKMSLLGLLSSSENNNSNPVVVRSNNHHIMNGVSIDNDNAVKQQSASSLPPVPSASYFTNGVNGGGVNGLSGVNSLTTNGIINQNPAPPQINNNNNTLNHNTHHHHRSFTPGTPLTAHRASHENLLRLITASPPAKFASSGPIDAEIQEQERTLMSFLKFAGSDVGNADNHTTINNNNDHSTTASIGSAGSSTTTIANELNVVGGDIDASSSSYNIINGTREILTAHNIFNNNTGKNMGFLDVLSSSSSHPFSNNNNISNAHRNQHDNNNHSVGSVNGVVGNGDYNGLIPAGDQRLHHYNDDHNKHHQRQDIASISSMGIVDQQQLLLQQLLNNSNHPLPQYHRRHDNNYVTGAGGNSFNIGEATATSSSTQIPAFANFKFDVDKILAAM